MATAEQSALCAIPAPTIEGGFIVTINLKRSEATKYHAHWISYLYEVARTGSIRGAAKSLNVAPSAVSRRLREVEALVGEPLFERGPRGLRLTAGGNIVAEHADQILRGLGQMQNSLDELRGLERGHVTIAASRSSAVELLPRIISAISKPHPRITFTCNFVGANETVDQIASGDADVGIAFNPPRSRLYRKIISVPLKFGAIMTPSNPLAKRRSIKAADLAAANVPFIFPDFTESTRSEIDNLLLRNGLDVHPIVTSSNRDFVVGIALHGGCVAIRTIVGSEREIGDGTLKFIPLKEPSLKHRHLTLFVHTTRKLSLAANLLVEVAKQHLKELMH